MMQHSVPLFIVLFSCAYPLSVLSQSSEIAMETIRNSILNEALTNTAQATRTFLNTQHDQSSLRNLRHITQKDMILPNQQQQLLLNDDIEFVASLAQTLLVSEEKQNDATNNNTAPSSSEETVWSADSVMISDVKEPNSVELIPKIKLDSNQPHFQPQNSQSNPTTLSVLAVEDRYPEKLQNTIPAKNMLCHVHQSKLHCTTLILDEILFDSTKECTISANGIMACERDIAI